MDTGSRIATWSVGWTVSVVVSETTRVKALKESLVTPLKEESPMTRLTEPLTMALSRAPFRAPF
jgi:hypothetical protein